MAELRQNAQKIGVSCLKAGIPGYYEWIETHAKIERAVKGMQFLREGLGPDIDIAIDFHAKTSPSVASILVKEVEPLNLLWIEEPCPPENIQAMHKIARRSKTPIATGERLVASYGCRELIEMGVIDILQTDINHVGGITGLWKVGALASFSNVSMAPHACEGPIGGLATIHVDAAMPNFLIQEICGGVEPSRQDKIWEEWLGFPAMRMVDGRFPLSNKPGLGFELSEASLAKYPFGGTKPMARVFHEDGSVAEW
jgi:galactonate dehydratase